MACPNIPYMIGRIRRLLRQSISREEILFRKHFGQSPSAGEITATSFTLERKARDFVKAVRIYKTRKGGIEIVMRVNASRKLNLPVCERYCRNELGRLYHTAVAAYQELEEAQAAAHHFYPGCVPEHPLDPASLIEMPRLRVALHEAAAIIKDSGPNGTCDLHIAA